MKNSMLILALSMYSLSASAQKIKSSDVPEAVRTTFQKLYPAADDVSWEKEDANFEVNFELGESETSVVFDALGHVLETEVEIAMAGLPANAKTYLEQNYSNRKIKEVTQITDAQGYVRYEVEIKGKDILFDASGNFLKVVED